MKTPNKLLMILILAAGFCLPAKAQKTKQLFKGYRNAKGVVGMSIGAPLVDLAIGFSDLDKADKKALRKMARGAGFFVIEDVNRKQEHQVLADFKNHLADDSFIDLITVKTEGNIVNVKLREVKGKLKELVVFANADDAVVGVVINGNFDKEHVKGLVKRFSNDDFDSFKVKFKQ